MQRTLQETGKVVGLFVVLGVGLGLSGYVGMDHFIPDAQNGEDFGAALIGGLLMMQAIVFMYLIGPAMAVVTGIFTGRHSVDRKSSAISGGAGAFVGFYVMFIVAFLIMSLAFPETSGNGGGGGGDSAINLADTLTQMILIGFPTGLAGAITGYTTGSSSG